MPAKSASDEAAAVLRPGRLTPPRSMFLHFFDQHFLEERGLGGGRARDEMDLAVRFGVMIATTIYVPAASWYESPLARELLRPFLGSLPHDLFIFAGSGASPDAFRAEKLEQYAPASLQGQIYAAADGNPPLAWRRRSRSATRDIAEGWLKSLDTGLAEPILARMQKVGATGGESLFEKIPELLGSRAFIVENVASLLGLNGNFLGQQGLHELINPEYFHSYGKDFKAAVFQNMSALGADFIVSGDPDRDVDFRELCRTCGPQLLRTIRKALPIELCQLAESEAFEQAFSFSQTSLPLAEPMNDKPLIIRGIEEALAVDLAIVVALPKEREAVEAVFGKGSPYMAPNDPMIYQNLELNIQGRTSRIIVATLANMGNANAAVAASNIARSFRVKRLAMIGIAGGCPDHKRLETHVRLGDVVISSKTLEWDNQKRTKDGEIECRATPNQVGHDWLQVVRQLQMETYTFDPKWLKRYRQGLRRQQIQAPATSGDILHDHEGNMVDHPADPRRKKVQHLIHLGVIGAGDTLLKDPKLRDQLRDRHQIRAVEMESSGIQAADWAHNGSFVTVRGIVDYCDGYKSDDWHRSAATAAAAVLYLMFETLLIAESAAA